MNIIPEDELWALPPLETLNGANIIELGNKKNSNGLYRTQYEEHGMKYNCVDWNGLDGAYEMDLGMRCLPEEVHWVHGWADVVTNFGFSEHVYTNQIQCWKNIAMLSSKVGCYLAMVLPHPGHWDHHGIYQPTMEWLQEWCTENGYWIHTGLVNDSRRRWVNVIGAQRIEPYDEVDYHTPSFDMMYITPKNKRVNPEEKRYEHMD